MSILNIVLIVLIIAVLGVIAFGYYLSYMLLKPKQRGKSRTPAEYGLPYEDLYFPSHGKQLHGWLVKQPQATEPLPLILLLHGWESNAQGMLPHAKFLFEAGFNLFLFDARGHGDSEPIDYMSLVRFTEDAENAMIYLESRSDIDSQKLALFGHSMGGASTIIIGARHPEIKAVAVSSTYAFFDLMIHDMFSTRGIPRWPFEFLLKFFWQLKLKVDVQAWSPGYNIGKIKAPLFLAYGNKDEVLSLKHFELLWKAVTSQAKEKVLIADGTHRNLYDSPEYKQAIVRFLLQHYDKPVNEIAYEKVDQKYLT